MNLFLLIIIFCRIIFLTGTRFCLLIFNFNLRKPKLNLLTYVNNNFFRIIFLARSRFCFANFNLQKLKSNLITYANNIFFSNHFFSKKSLLFCKVINFNLQRFKPSLIRSLIFSLFFQRKKFSILIVIYCFVIKWKYYEWIWLFFQIRDSIEMD